MIEIFFFEAESHVLRRFEGNRYCPLIKGSACVNLNYRGFNEIKRLEFILK